MKQQPRYGWMVSVLLLCGLIGFTGTGRIPLMQPEILPGTPLPVRDSAYLRSQITYSRQYPFIRYQLNYPEWKDSLALGSFFRALSRSDRKKVKVLHIGDSHVQADFVTGEIRDRMQQTFGPGGRGFVFPYAAAGTHNTRDYRTWSYGVWKYARNIQTTPEFTLGLTGATIYTEDANAGFRFQFREGFIQQKDLVLKIYCDKNIRSFDALIIYPGGDTLLVNCHTEDGLPYSKILLPAPPVDFTMRLVPHSEESVYFQCYGLSIENIQAQGILYSSVGINGAGYTALLRQGLMPEQLREINPDLVVIDLGANDFYPRVIDQPVFEENLKNIVRIIRGVCPGISILVTCSQDIYCRKRNVAECKRFAAIARNIAFEMQCGFYDYYRISGGQYAMNKWYQNQLAKPDRVHLTAAGYSVKGQLYSNAYLNAYCLWLGGVRDSFLLSDIGIPESVAPAREESGPPAGATKYTVRSGDNLGSIARRHGISIAQLKTWNGLASDNIRIGQVLYVKPKSGTSTSPATAPAKEIPKTQPARSTGKVYVVRSGDTLWGIARNNHCTVEEIKSLNGIRSEALKPGMKLTLP